MCKLFFQGTATRSPEMSYICDSCRSRAWESLHPVVCRDEAFRVCSYSITDFKPREAVYITPTPER